MNTTPNNPYAKAAGAYGEHAQKHTPDQRELEARVLLKSAKVLKDLRDNWADVTTELLDGALRYNRQIWMMFYDTAIENSENEQRPDDLRSNIINLANFIFKREVEIMADKERKPDKLDVLISINKEIAAGLMSSKKQMPPTQPSTPAEQNRTNESTEA